MAEVPRFAGLLLPEMFKQHLRADTHLSAKPARSVVATDALMQFEQIDHGAEHPKRLDRGSWIVHLRFIGLKMRYIFLAGPCWAPPASEGAFAAPAKSTR